MTIMPILICAATLFSVLAQNPSAVQQPSLLDSLKQFEGHWKGPFKMQQTAMDVDMTWKSFGGHWVELSYTYTAPKLKLEYRVLISTNEKGDGFNVWSFGNDAKTADLMTGKMESNVLKVDRVAKDPFTIQFSLSDQKELQMKIVTRGDNPKEVGGAVLKPVTGF